MWAYDRDELGDNVEVSRTDDALIVGRRLTNWFRRISAECNDTRGGGLPCPGRHW